MNAADSTSTQPGFVPSGASIITIDIRVVTVCSHHAAESGTAEPGWKLSMAGVAGSTWLNALGEVVRLVDNPLHIIEAIAEQTESAQRLADHCNDLCLQIAPREQ